MVMIFYPAPYYITYANLRYRHAIEPELLMVACFFACALWDHTRARFRFVSGGDLAKAGGQ
jgi:hypothetical protein